MFDSVELTAILAVAGSGKTKWIVDHVIENLKTMRPEEIGFVTFTRAGAAEGLHRICSVSGLAPDELPYFSTIHSMCYHAMDYKHNQLFNSLYERRFNRQYGYVVNRSQTKTGLKRTATADTMYLEYYDLVRTHGLSPVQKLNGYDIDIDHDRYVQIVADYNKFKKENNLVDFYDCLVQYALHGNPLPCRVVYIDECQDLSELQWLVIQRAFVNAEKVYVAGDDCQTIYSYNGARSDLFIDIVNQPNTQRVHLSKSWRIPNSVYRIARAIMDRVSVKIDKPFEQNPDAIEGEVINLPAFSDVIPYIKVPDREKAKCQWYILARNRKFLLEVQEKLEEAVIPYWTDEGFCVPSSTLEAIHDYENFGKKGYKTQAYREKFMEKYRVTNFGGDIYDTEIFSDGHKFAYKAYYDKYGYRTLKEMRKWTPQIQLSTVHQVKGGEAENVVYLLDCTNATANNAYVNLDEELRIMYVAVTRTRKRLFTVSANSVDSVLDTIFSETIKNC